eukprot:TRINITY_DN2595_c2_g1_i1.p2 TRINITY_DN2595_c2_g1~~TRINITY_DN2595_c2_g1_i1.p2  ORF type:complete len:101 (+),score=27.67 TRINITY_DN2595_c2_g1_i1:69-371(+)
MGVFKMFKMCFSVDKKKKKTTNDDSDYCAKEQEPQQVDGSLAVEKGLEAVAVKPPSQDSEKDAPLETDDSCSIEIHSSVEDSEPEYLYTSADYECESNVD